MELAPWGEPEPMQYGTRHNLSEKISHAPPKSRGQFLLRERVLNLSLHCINFSRANGRNIGT